MANKILIIFFICIAVSCKRNEPETVTHEIQTEPVPKTIENTEIKTDILPGQTIGNIALEMDSQELQSLLGTPDLQDAAMGKAWQTWYSTNSDSESGKYELNVFTNYKDKEMKQKVVRLIRVTSPDFKVDSISTGKSLDEIKAAFPEMRYAGAYPYDDTKDFVELYDDKKQGIAFEFLKNESGNHCIAVIVHPKNEDVTLQYRTFRPDLVLE